MAGGGGGGEVFDQFERVVRSDSCDQILIDPGLVFAVFPYMSKTSFLTLESTYVHR
jgi:hypothetical protein